MCFENDGWDDDWGEESEEACDQENAQAELIEKARGIVADFHSSGTAYEHEENKKHDEHCEYRTSSEHRIATQTLQLEKLLDEYDNLRSDFYADLTEVGLYEGRISMLVESLDEYQSKLEHFERKEEDILDLYDCGKISAQEMDDRLTETGFSKQRAGTRTESPGRFPNQGMNRLHSRNATKNTIQVSPVLLRSKQSAVSVGCSLNNQGCIRFAVIRG